MRRNKHGSALSKIILLTNPLSPFFHFLNFIFINLPSYPFLLKMWFLDQQYRYYWELIKNAESCALSRPAESHFNKISRWFMCIFKFEKYWSNPRHLNLNLLQWNHQTSVLEFTDHHPTKFWNIWGSGEYMRIWFEPCTGTIREAIPLG